MEKYIIDANLFFNMEAGLDLGKNSEEVVKKITLYSKKLKEKAVFLMPPKVVDEFLSFFPEPKTNSVVDFLSAITVKSPDYEKIVFSAQIFHRLIEDIRTRSYRGLGVAEEEIVKAAELMVGQEKMTKKDFQIKVGGIIKNFRLRYRRATRFGFLDSTADLDLIVLAKETNGFLVSTDEGVVGWGRLFGVKEVPPGVWKKRLEDLVFHQE